jgi:hypothetical protein
LNGQLDLVPGRGKILRLGVGRTPKMDLDDVESNRGGGDAKRYN